MQIAQIMHYVGSLTRNQGSAEPLAEFKDRRRHLAVVVDEFGSTAGDYCGTQTLEQLVNIEDEFEYVSPSEPALEDESIRRRKAQSTSS